MEDNKNIEKEEKKEGIMKSTDVNVQDETKKKRKIKKQKTEDNEQDEDEETNDEDEDEETNDEDEDEETNTQLEQKKETGGIIIKDYNKRLYKKNLEEKTPKYPYIKTNDNFKQLIKLLNDIKNEHTLIFNEKQLNITTIDETHTSLINININYDHPMFEEMEIPYPMELTIDTKIMSDILKAFNSNIILIPQNNTVTVKDNVKTYKFATLIDKDSKPKIPNIDENLKIHTKISINNFKDAIHDCNRVSEHLCFATKNNELHVSGENDSNTVFFETILPRKSDINVVDEGRSMFNLDLLQKIFGIEKFADELEMRFGTDMPLKILCNIEEGQHVYGDITYMVAPRVESD